jgi:hypothetical protein
LEPGCNIASCYVFLGTHSNYLFDAQLLEIHIIEYGRELVSRHSRNMAGWIMTIKENGRLVVEDVANMAGKTCTEIDLKDRVIRKTWKLMGFARFRTYELDNHVTVQIKDTSTILEGYSITSFGVYLAGRDRKIRISSTGDLKEARLIQNEITAFLKEAQSDCS